MFYYSAMFGGAYSAVSTVFPDSVQIDPPPSENHFYNGKEWVKSDVQRWDALLGSLMVFPEYVQLIAIATGEDGNGGNTQAMARISMLSDCLNNIKQLPALQGVLTGETADPTVGSAGLVLSLKNANLWSADLRDRLRTALDNNGFGAIVLPAVE